MTENLDLSQIPKHDPYVPVELKVIGQKEVTSGKTGKTHRIVVCEDQDGNEVSLFDWGLCTRSGKLFVLAKHLRNALTAAQKRNI